MVKPDAVQRGLVHKLILRLESRGFKLVAMKLCKPEKALFEEHYAEHRGKPFFEGLVNRITEGPVVAMVWEGDDIVPTTRKMIGATDPAQARPGTFRGDFGLSKQKNGFHGSDSAESAEREINLWFDAKEIIGFKSVSEPWLYEGRDEKSAAEKPGVPALNLEKVSTPQGEQASGQSSALRTAGIVGAAAIGIAVAAGVYVAKKRNN